MVQDHPNMTSHPLYLFTDGDRTWLFNGILHPLFNLWESSIEGVLIWDCYDCPYTTSLYRVHMIKK